MLGVSRGEERDRSKKEEAVEEGSRVVSCMAEIVRARCSLVDK